MNDDRHDEFDDLLAPLRDLESAVDHESIVLDDVARRRRAWWRRSIAVPVPVAAAAVLAFVAVLAWSALRAPALLDDDVIAVEADGPSLERQVRTVSVSGLGTIHSTQRFVTAANQESES